MTLRALFPQHCQRNMIEELLLLAGRLWMMQIWVRIQVGECYIEQQGFRSVWVWEREREQKESRRLFVLFVKQPFEEAWLTELTWTVMVIVDAARKIDTMSLSILERLQQEKQKKDFSPKNVIMVLNKASFSHSLFSP